MGCRRLLTPQFPRGSTLITREATQIPRASTLITNAAIEGEGGRDAAEEGHRGWSAATTRLPSARACRARRPEHRPRPWRLSEQDGHQFPAMTPAAYDGTRLHAHQPRVRE
jgi:hypothetical protein